MELVHPDLVEKKYGGATNLAYNEKIKRMINEGHAVYHFGFGQSPFPVLEVASSALREHATESAYLPVQGLPELRKGICDFHHHYDHVSCDPEDVVVAPGSKELILLLMTTFNGVILLNSPAWTTYRPQAMLAGHSPTVVDSREEDEWRVTPQGLEKAVESLSPDRYKLLVLCNPCNPSGACYTEDQLRDIVKTCRNHKILILSDEIYGRIHYTGEHVCITKVYPEGGILCSGMSKWAGAGGWRVLSGCSGGNDQHSKHCHCDHTETAGPPSGLEPQRHDMLGYHIYPKDLQALREVVSSAGSHSYSCAPAPIQLAFAQVLHNLPACDEYINHVTRVMRAVAEFCVRELRSVGVKVSAPRGGFYMFPNFEIIRPALTSRGIVTGQDMCHVILKDVSVALLPGGPTHNRPAQELTARLCFVNFDGAIALAASKSRSLIESMDDKFVKDCCRPVYDGISALKAWVTKLKAEEVQKPQPSNGDMQRD